MRTRHAFVLSVVAVLTAGMAAAIVNSRALAGSGGHTDISLSSVPALTDATPTDASTTTIGTVTTQQVFTIGDAGVLTLDRADGALVVVSVAPAIGWQVAAVTHVSDNEISVELTSPTDHATVAAVQSADGIVVTITETTSTPVSAPPQPSTSSTATTASSVAPPRSDRPTATTAVTPPTAIASATTRPTTSPTATTTTSMTTDDHTLGTPVSEPDGDHRQPDD